MVNIPVVDQDLDLLQDLNLSYSLADDNLSIEVSVYDNIDGAQKYEFTDRSDFIHGIHIEDKAGHISPPISTDPIISDSVSMASSNTDICKHTPEDYMF